jgi:hypothetical protein
MQMTIEKAAQKVEMEAEKRKEIRHKMERIESKIKLWMTTNQLPDQLAKEHIINCIQHRPEENKDIDSQKSILQYLFQYLSEDLIDRD